MTQNQFKHWQMAQDAEHIMWLCFNRQGASMNTISDEVLTEFNQILDLIIKRHDLTGLVIYSGKENSFIAGADIEHFSQLENPDEILVLVTKGQEIFSKLELFFRKSSRINSIKK